MLDAMTGLAPTMPVRALLLAAAAGAALAGAGAGAAADASPTVRIPGQNIYSVRGDGTGLRRLTRAPDDLAYESPAWSPSGRWIAFTGPPCDDCPELVYLIDLARHGAIARVPGTPPRAVRPSWGPQDRSLTIVAGLTDSVFTLRRQGTGLRRLTSGQVAHDQSAFSPNGRRIAYTQQQTNGGWDILLMRSDGSGKRNLTRTATSEQQPAWSRDGRRLAFARQIGGKWAIFTMPAAGGAARRLTPLADNSQQPAWSPDDRRIAYTQVTNGGASIFVMGADGTGRRRLRTGTHASSSPSWSPDGLRIAFTGVVR